ncbi:MAG TPA: hypothetical protein ENG95_06005 [Nitrospirae bacterium]|nr:hypothetical protein BMS3Abin09_00002 [bacterium BMS3Abin09]GBE40785.1 hypothetical protein BMS3Bbin09_00671 [bacterium BMS3Bbin09]HDO26176.1 hypothetical protein [Nitrospirota bacterium]
MVIIFFILMLIFLVYILVPLINESYWPFVSRGTFAVIQEEKKECIRAISDVDFEYEMGKLTKEDYMVTREFLKRQARPALEKERDFSKGITLKPGKEISKSLKKSITKEVLRICGKKLLS